MMSVRKLAVKLYDQVLKGRKFEQSCWLLVSADICFPSSVIGVQSVSAKIHIGTSLELIILLSMVGVQENVLTNQSPNFIPVCLTRESLPSSADQACRKSQQR